MTAVYIILEGRVNCLGSRSICFKSYVEGSYFGEVEVIHNCPRLFSAKAQEHSTLLKLTTEQFKRLVDHCPEFYTQILQQSVKRHMKIKISMEETKKFELVLRNEAFWFYKLNNEPLKIEIDNLLKKLQRNKEPSKSMRKVELLTRRPSIHLKNFHKRSRNSLSIVSSRGSIDGKPDHPKSRVLVSEVVDFPDSAERLVPSLDPAT